MGQSVRPLSCTKTMYAFQERPENFSGWLAPCPGSAAAQRNAAGRVLKAHASEKRCRRNSQRVGAWARNETNKVSGASRVRLSHYFMGAACNVKRYLNLLA